MAITVKPVKTIARETKTMIKDMAKTANLPNDIHRGYKQGIRLTRMNHQNKIYGIKNSSIGVIRKGLANHLGGILGIASFPIPIPGISVGLYYLGKKLGIGLTKILK